MEIKREIFPNRFVHLYMFVLSSELMTTRLRVSLHRNVIFQVLKGSHRFIFSLVNGDFVIVADDIILLLNNTNTRNMNTNTNKCSYTCMRCNAKGKYISSADDTLCPLLSNTYLLLFFLVYVKIISSCTTQRLGTLFATTASSVFLCPSLSVRERQLHA